MFWVEASEQNADVAALDRLGRAKARKGRRS